MSSSSNVDPMKKSSIYATFGRYYGEKLYKLLFDCCSGLPGSFCYEVLKCLNISPQGNADLVLNQQGEWIQNSSGGSLLVKKIELTSAQILALNTTPITAILAPGIGYAISPISITYQYNYNTTDYTGGSNITGYANTKTIVDGLFNVSSLIVTASENKSGVVFSSSSTSADGIVENQSLLLGCNSPFVDGNGNLVLWILYALIEI